MFTFLIISEVDFGTFKKIGNHKNNPSFSIHVPSKEKPDKLADVHLLYCSSVNTIQCNKNYTLTCAFLNYHILNNFWKTTAWTHVRYVQEKSTQEITKTTTKV